MKIVLPEVRHLGEDAEVWWKKLPRGVRKLINESCGRPIELTRILFDFVPKSMVLMASDELYDCNFPRSIDVAYLIASDMFSKGQIHESVHLVFFAAMLNAN